MLREITFDCAAYTAYKTTPNSITGYVTLTDGMKLACVVNNHWRRFTVGAIRLDDLKPGQSYDEAVAAEMAKPGGKQHWINQDCAVISNSPTAKEKVNAVEIGQTVLMQGVVYEIMQMPNGNLALREPI